MPLPSWQTIPKHDFSILRAWASFLMVLLLKRGYGVKQLRWFAPLLESSALLLFPGAGTNLTNVWILKNFLCTRPCSANCSSSHMKLAALTVSVSQKLALNTRVLHLEQQPRNNLLPFLTSESPLCLFLLNKTSRGFGVRGIHRREWSSEWLRSTVFTTQKLNTEHKDEVARNWCYTWMDAVHLGEYELHDVSGKCQNFLY